VLKVVFYLFAVCLKIMITVVLTGKIIKVREELNRSDSTSELTTDSENKVNKAAAK